MGNNSVDKWDELIAKLLDIDLLPETDEEATQTLKELDIDIESVKIRSLQIFGNLLGEFSDNWRNKLKNKKTHVDVNTIPLKLSLSAEELKDRLGFILDKLSGGNETIASSMVGFRNLKNIGQNDLAILLRQFELMALESGIRIDEEI